MFNTLRQNSDLYMIDKVGIPILKIGKILMIKPTQVFYTNPLESTLDITVSADNETVEFKQVPSNLSLATMGNVIIAETKELMCQEVESMLKTSRQIIESTTYHNEVIEACDGILKKLNPQLAKEKMREEKIELLENKVSGMESTLSDIKAMLSKAINN